MRPIFSFLSYHNAVPAALVALVLGAGGAFAAVDPGAIYSAEVRVLAPDNSYLVGADLDAYSPAAEIVAVTEDEERYFVVYLFSTIDIEEHVWRDVTREETMRVSKSALGEDRDLGLYVAEQLRQKIARELERLKKTQSWARENVSSKVVATAYGGLVGAFLDGRTETLPDYVPVVKERERADDPAALSSAGQESAAPPPPSREEIERMIERRVRELAAQQSAERAEAGHVPKPVEASAGGTKEVPPEPTATTTPELREETQSGESTEPAASSTPASATPGIAAPVDSTDPPAEASADGFADRPAD